MKLALGITAVPGTLRDEIDPVLANSREKYGVTNHDDPEPVAHTPDSTGQHTVATDGGQLIGTEAEAATGSTTREPTITGPHMEPSEISNATTFWRCEDCGHESIREQDVYRTMFHAEGCAGSE